MVVFIQKDTGFFVRRLIDIGPKSSLAAALSYSDKVLESSVVNFNEYGSNKTLMFELFLTKTRPSESGETIYENPK